MLFAVLALTVVAAATAAGPARLEMEGSFSDPTGPLPAASDHASDSTLSLRGHTLAITAGADACTGNSTGLAAAECSAWQDLYNKTGGTSTDLGVRNATVRVIELCVLSRLLVLTD